MNISIYPKWATPTRTLRSYEELRDAVFNEKTVVDNNALMSILEERKEQSNERQQYINHCRKEDTITRPSR